MRRLIINADDFGLTAGVNRAIVEAHERGVVTSATLMANGQAFEDASLWRNPGLGWAWVVTSSWWMALPLLDRTQVRSLLDRSDGSGDPHFREGIARFGALALLGRLDEDEIEAEASAQIRKLQAAGIAVTHLDSHKHTHLFPRVLRPLLRAAASCGVTGDTESIRANSGLAAGCLPEFVEAMDGGRCLAQPGQAISRSGAGKLEYQRRMELWPSSPPARLTSDCFA